MKPLPQIISLAEELYQVPDEELIFYEREGKEMYYELTGKLLEALKNNRFLEALRISNYFAEDYRGDIHFGEVEHNALKKIREMAEKFELIKVSLQNEGNVSLCANLKDEPYLPYFVLKTESDVEALKVAYLVDRICGYYSPLIQGNDGGVFIQPFLPMSPYLAYIEKKAPKKFGVILRERPLEDITPKGLATIINSSI